MDEEATRDQASADDRTTRRQFIAAAGTALAAGVAAAIAACTPRGLNIGPVPLVAPSGYVNGFKIQHAEPGPFPAFDEATWTLQVSGLVAAPVTLTWREFLSLPQTRVTNDFTCVEGWTVPHVMWEGVRVIDLIDHVRPRSSAAVVVFGAEGGVYTDTLTMHQASDPRAMLASRMNGAALDVKQGRPLRLVVPGMYGYKSVKWVRKIAFVQRAGPGYWEQRGYPIDATLPG